MKPHTVEGYHILPSALRVDLNFLYSAKKKKIKLLSMSVRCNNEILLLSFFITYKIKFKYFLVANFLYIIESFYHEHMQTPPTFPVYMLWYIDKVKPYFACSMHG